MDLNAAAHCAIELLHTVRDYEVIQVLLPQQLVLAILAASSLVEVHDPALDGIFMPVVDLGLLR